MQHGGYGMMLQSHSDSQSMNISSRNRHNGRCQEKNPNKKDHNEDSTTTIAICH